MTSETPIADAFGALTDGRWAEARTAFAELLSSEPSADAVFGLATALFGVNAVTARRP